MTTADRPGAHDFDAESPLGAEFHLADWKVESELHRLSHGEKTVRVRPKVMDVLRALAVRSGRVVSREELLAQVWNGTTVGDEAVTHAVSELRRIFGDRPGASRFIETIPKRGYRLIVTPAGARPVDGTPPDGAEPRRGGKPDLRWRAVLAAGGLLLLFGGAIGHLSPNAGVIHDPIPLTSLPGWEIQPDLSPDGTHVVFNHEGDLYLRQVDGGATLRLTETVELEGEPTFSPDGTRVAFSRFDSSGRSEAYPIGRCGLYVMPALGGMPHRLADCGGYGPALMSWHPAGDWIVFESGAPRLGTEGLRLVSVATGEVRPLPLADAGLPSFSADGRFLAFARGRLGTVSLHVAPIRDEPGMAPAVDGPSRQVLEARQQIGGFDWTPDGRGFVYSRYLSGVATLWRVGIDGGPPTRLAVPAHGAVEPSVAPLDGRLVYVNETGVDDIWRLDLAHGSEPRAAPFIVSTWGDYCPRLSPDGRRLAFVSGRSGRFEIWLGDADGTGLAQLTRTDSLLTVLPVWSPDGRTIAYSTIDERGAEVYLVGAQGGPSRRLSGMSYPGIASYWSRDGRWLYLSSGRSGSLEIWKQPTDGGDAVRVSDSGGMNAREDASGSYLYYVKPMAWGLWRRPLSGGGEEQVVAELAPADWNYWEVRPEGVYFLRRIPALRPHIARANFDEGTVENLADLPMPVATGISGFAILGEGDTPTILFSRNDRFESDVLMVEGMDW